MTKAAAALAETIEAALATTAGADMWIAALVAVKHSILGQAQGGRMVDTRDRAAWTSLTSALDLAIRAAVSLQYRR